MLGRSIPKFYPYNFFQNGFHLKEIAYNRADMQERDMRKKNIGSVSPLEKHSSLTFSLYHMSQVNAISVYQSQNSLLLTFITFWKLCFPLCF